MPLYSAYVMNLKNIVLLTTALSLVGAATVSSCKSNEEHSANQVFVARYHGKMSWDNSLNPEDGGDGDGDGDCDDGGDSEDDNGKGEETDLTNDEYNRRVKILLKEGGLAAVLNDPEIGRLVLEKRGLGGILNNPEKAKLYSLDGLEHVDTSEKKVTVDLPKDFVDLLGKYYNPVLEKVSQFYKGHNVNIDFRTVSSIDSSVLKPAEHFAIKVVDDEVLGDSAGRAKLKKSTVYIPDDIVVMNEDVEYEMKRIGNLVIPHVDSVISELLIHELGHLFGITHANMFEDGPLNNSEKDHCMISGRESGENICSIQDANVKIMHSYLEKGRVYQAMSFVDFNPGNYYLLVGVINGYQFSTSINRSEDN